MRVFYCCRYSHYIIHNLVCCVICMTRNIFVGLCLFHSYFYSKLDDFEYKVVPTIFSLSFYITYIGLSGWQLPYFCWGQFEFEILLFHVTEKSNRVARETGIDSLLDWCVLKDGSDSSSGFWSGFSFWCVRSRMGTFQLGSWNSGYTSDAATNTSSSPTVTINWTTCTEVGISKNKLKKRCCSYSCMVLI